MKLKNTLVARNVSYPMARLPKKTTEMTKNPELVRIHIAHEISRGLGNDLKKVSREMVSNIMEGFTNE